MYLNNSSHIIPVCILCVFLCVKMIAQNSQQDHKQQPCISEAEYQRVYSRCEANVKKLDVNVNKGTSIPLLEWPLQLAPGFDYPSYYVINNYVDHNPIEGFLLDYNCGNRTYDRDDYDHSGTDIDLDPFEWQMMDEGAVQVIAAASGVILDKMDGFFDQNCSCEGNANYLIIRHDDGSRTWYWHLKQNSVTSKEIGDFISTGEYIGLVGSSGCSSHPHLHFEVRSPNNFVVDPFTGPCNNVPSLWANQLPYHDSGINRIGTYAYVPSHEVPDCPNAHSVKQQDYFYTVPSDVIVIELDLRHTQSGQSAAISVVDPLDNLVMWNEIIFLNDAERYKRNTSVNLNILSGFVSGKYTVTVNYFGQTATHDFWITDGCISNRVINNQTHSYDRWYNASQTIVSDSDSNAGVETLYNANDRITMTPGFSAKNGFHAYLGNACPN